MKKNSMRFLSFLLLAMMMVSLLALGVLAEGEGTSTNVAKIGDVSYESLSAALSAAENGKTITVLNDCVVNGDVTIPAGVTLNTNGKKVTVDGTVTNLGTIAVNGGELKAAVVSNMAHMVVPEKVPPQFAEGATARDVSVSFVPEGATESRYNYTFTLAAGSSVLDVPVDVLPDGKYNCTIVDFIDGQTHVILGTTTIVNGAIKINGGALTVSQTLANNYGTLAITGESKLNLTGAEFNGNLLIPNANLTITGGTITNDDKSVSGIEINAGKLILNNVTVKSARHALRVDGAVNVVIDGGYYQGAVGTGTGTYHALHTSNGAVVTIANGTFVGPKGDPNTTADSGSAVNVGSGCTVTIKNGDFYGGKSKTLQSASTLIVEGGIFDQDPSAYVALPYAVQKVEGGYKVVDAVASIGTKGYASLADAIEAAETMTGEVEIFFVQNTALDGAVSKYFFYPQNNVLLKGDNLVADFSFASRFYLMDVVIAEGSKLANASFDSISYVTIAQGMTVKVKMLNVGQAIDKDDVNADDEATRDGGAMNVVVDGVLEHSNFYVTSGSTLTVTETGKVVLISAGGDNHIRAGATLVVNGTGTDALQFESNWVSIRGGDMKFYNTYAKTGTLRLNADLDNALVVGDTKAVLIVSGSKLEAYSIELDNVDSEFAVSGGSVVTITSVLENLGTITISAGSSVVTNKLDNNGKIIIDATGFTGFKKIIDVMNAASVAGEIEVAGNDNAYVVCGEDGDVYLSTVSRETLYVDAAFSGKICDEIADGMYFGVNAFGNFEDAIAFASSNSVVKTIKLLSDVTLTSVNNTTAYYDIGTLAIVADESFTVSGCGFALRVSGNGASLTIGENVTIEGLDVVANGFATSGEKLIVNGTLKALSLKQWTSNGTITIGETGCIVLGYGDGQFDMAYGNGNVIINGNGDMTVPQFKAGYSGTRGNGGTLTLNNTYFEAGAWFNVNGSNTTIVLNDSILKVSGGDSAGKLTIAAGNTIYIGAGSQIAAGAVSGAGKIVIDASGMTAGVLGTVQSNLSGFTGTIEVANNDLLYAEIRDGKIVLVNYVAMIGDQGYKTLQDAINNVANGETIDLMTACAENVTVVQTPGVAFTIDGNGKTYSGTITVDGKSAAYATAGLTIENVKFDATNISKDACINLGVKGDNNTRYTSNVTVIGCTFAGNIANEKVAVKNYTGGCKKLTITDCTATGMHSLAQLKGVAELTVTDVTVNGKNGISVGTSTGITITEANITATGYGIRVDASVDTKLTIGNSTINAYTPVVVREATASGYAIDFTDTYMTAGNGKYYVVVGKTEYEAGKNLPVDASYAVEITGLSDDKIWQPLEGTGTEEDPYRIENLDDLIFFRDSVNAGDSKYSAPGVYVVLAADIDLAGQNWVAIGSAEQAHGFMGNFDGKGFTIKNLTITNPELDSDGYAYAGFFGITEGIDKDNQNVIKNLVIENVTISTTGHIVAGAIAYPYYTILDKITVCGNIAIEGGNYTAGVLAYTRRCTTASNISVIGAEGSYITGAQTVGGVISDIQMNGGLTANYSNFVASGLTITGDKCVGGITGIIANQTLKGATVENVTLVCSDSRVGVVAGSLGGTSTITNVNVSDVTGATVIVGGAYDGGAAVQAKIVDTYYATFADALAAAKDGETITLIWTEGDAPIAMNGAVFGKTVTITGTATVDWSKGFLFIGRGGEGNGTVIFDNANLTSASNSASYGIHVSGREKDTNNKYDGTLVIKNSTIVLDYLINKGTMTLDNSTLTVKNGFSIGGRPASETESGVDATATITLNNGSKVVVNNHNGMGLGYEAIGVMNVNSGSTFETTQSFLITAKGTLNVNGGTVKVAGKLTTNKNFFISGNSTVQIEDLQGRATVMDGTTLTNSYIKSTTNGTTRVLGDLTLKGGFSAAYLMTAGSHTVTSGYEGTITIEGGATVNISYGVEMNGNLTLDGGTIELSGGNANGKIWGMVFQSGTFEINTDLVVIGNTGTYAPIYFTNATATINSSITQKNSGGEPLYIGNTSVVTLGTDAVIDALSVHGAGKLIIDATGMTEGEYANIKCGASGFTGTIEVINNNLLYAEVRDGKIVLVNYVAKIDNSYYKTLEEAFAAAEEGDTIILLTDATPALQSQRAITKASVIDLNGKTLTLTEDDLYFGSIEFKNGTIVVDPSVKASTAVFWMFENQTLTFDKVNLVATGVTGTYLIGINGGSGTQVNIVNSTITIDNETTANLSAVICDNGTGNTVVIDNSTINVKNIEGRVYLGGKNGTITVIASDLDLNGVKEGFYLRAGQNLSIEGDSNVAIVLNTNEGRYGINLANATAKYIKADSATVNATSNSVAQIGATYYATLADALAAAKDQKNIVIDLVADATLDITAWDTLAIGGETTETITINGNGKTLTFNKLNSDWNHIITKNDAKLILNNVTLADSGKNNGPWNRYDINFACDVELNNVISNKALAFKADAALTDVTVNETGDNYAIWIQANGQTVTINGLTVNSAGRGIKIDEQYVDAAACVELTVTNATFTTAKKAAILVKSVAGAEIDLSNVDISGVAADTVNAVWVDADSAEYFGKVTVNGASKAQEDVTEFAASLSVNGEIMGYYKTLQAAIAAAQAGDNTIKLLVDSNEDITIKQVAGVNVIIDGNNKEYSGTITIHGNSNYGDETLTIKNFEFVTNEAKHDFIWSDSQNAPARYPHNVTIEYCSFKAEGAAVNSAVAIRIRQGKNIIVTNSTAEGLHSFMQATGNTGITVNNVTITGCKNGISIGTSDAVITNSTINTSGYGIRADGSAANSLTVTDVAIKANQPVIVRKLTVAGYNLTVEDCALDATSSDGYKVIMTAGDDDVAYIVPVTTDYELNTNSDNVYPDSYFVAKIGEQGYLTITEALAAVKNDETIKLVADTNENITIKQVEGVNITIDGNGKTYSGTITIHGNARHTGTETLTIQNVNFVTDKAGHYFIDSNSTASAERYAHNVTVKNCTFTATGAGENSAAAMRIRQGYNISIENVTATGLHSVLQAYGNSGITVDGLTITDGKNGISAGTSTKVVVKNSKINVSGYGVRADGTGAYDLTVEDSTITADLPVVIRKATGAYVANVAEGNTLTATNDNGYTIVVTTGDDDETFVAPSDVELRVNAGANDKVFGMAAKIGNTYYGTFAQAYAAAKADDTIVLFAPVVITVDTELDLTGKTVDGNGVYPAFRVQNGATLTVKGGTIINATDYVFVLGASDQTSDGNLVIKNGTFKGQTSVASVTMGTLTIKGGTFECLEGAYGSAYLLNCVDANYKKGSAKIEIVGGTFKGFNPQNNVSEGANTNFLTTEYAVVYADGAYTVVNSVAHINGFGYATITGAINAAKDGETVEIFAGTFDEIVTIAKLEKNITIKGADNFGTILKGGIKIGVDNNANDSGSVTIEGISFIGNGVSISDLAKVTITNNKFTDITGIAAIYVQADNYTANVEISNNVITSVKTGIRIRNAVNAAVTNNTVDKANDNAILLEGTVTGSVVVTYNKLSNWGLSGEGRAIRISAGATAQSVIVEKNVMIYNGKAPEEFVKITGTAANAVVSLDENYWNGVNPVKYPPSYYDVKGVNPTNYYVDDALTDLREIVYVAEINGRKYLSIEEAALAAKDGDVIKLLVDLTVSDSIVIENKTGASFTIDLNGKTLSAASGLSSKPVVRVLAKVTFKNGTVDGGSGLNSYAFIVGNSDTAGELTIENGSYIGITTVVSVTKGTAFIKGGEFTTEHDNEGTNYGTHYMLNLLDGADAQIIVTGGKFMGFNPANNTAEGANTSFVDKGGYHAMLANGAYIVSAHKTVSVDAIDATCTTAGMNAGTKCADCGEILSGCKEIAALGHAKETVTFGEQTCTTASVTYDQCTVCGCVLTTPVFNQALGHDYQVVLGVNINGYEVHKCVRCDDTYTGDKLIADLIVIVDGIGYTDWADAMADMADGAQMIVLYSNVNNDLVTAIRGISKKAAVLDLNGYTLEIKELTLKSGNTMYIVDSSAKKTGSVIVSRILLEAGNDLRLADTVYYNGAVQMNNTKTYPSTFYVGDTRLVGTDGIFTIDQADTGYLQLILKDSIMDLTLGVGHLTMINDLSLLPQQKLTINVYGHLTIAEHVVLTLDADTTLSVLENNHGKGQIDGKGTIVVNTLDQFLTVLDTDIENIVLGTAMTISEDLTLDISGKTITATGDAFIVTAGTLTINGNGVVKAGTSGVGSWCAVWANGGNVVINGGTYSVGGDKESADKTHQNDVIYTKDKGTVVINGGLFLNDGTVWTLNENDANRGTITVNGGSFENWNPANNVSEGAGTNFLADGLCTAENNGIYEVVKHSYNAVVTAPTCTAEGYTTYTCSACGDTYVADKTAALGHKYDKVVTDPTCTTEGYTTYTCSVCGYTYVADKVAAKGHTVAIDDAVAPTCTATGLTVGVHCSVCKEVLVKQATVAAKGHTWTPATYEAPKTCSVCGATEGEAFHAVAQIGAIKYATLAEAIAAAQNGDTITLLTNSTGSGVVIDKSITIDFAGYTYSFKEGVGSTGTQSNGFQILKGNTVTLKNGTLNVDASAAAMFYILVQNYADLTVTDMILDGTNLDKYSLTDGDSYTLSNNSGKVVVNGNTTIIANNDGNLAFAFDACDKSAWGYELPTVTVADTVVINGNVEAAAVVNGTYYATFADALAAAQAGDVVVLLANATGSGAVIDKSITIDLNGKTYTVNKTVGSAGTTTLGFQILKGNDVTFKNGTLAATATVEGKPVKVLIQNYANLTLTDVVLDGTGSKDMLYVLSNNCGDTVIEGNSKIIAPDSAVAFDVWDYRHGGYTLPTVTVADTVVINGKVEAAAVVSGTYYATFAQAYAEAKAGDTIVLLTPVVVTEDTVLDLTGLTIEAAGDAFVVEAGTLTLNGDGVVKAGTSGVGSWCAVWANGGHVIINGGTYSVGGDKNSTDGNHQNDVIYTKKGGTVVINGGTFLNDGTVWTLNQNDSTGGKITVHGGTFHNWDPKNNVSEGADTSFVADGYCSIGKDNVYVVVVRPIGDVSGDGQVTSLDVTLLKRYTAGYDVTIDLSMADVDGDGFVTILDATLLSRYKAGLLDKLPAQA